MPHNRLYHNGVRLTLGKKPVRFFKKVYLEEKSKPKYVASSVSIGFNPISTDSDLKLMPAKKRLNPLHGP